MEFPRMVKRTLALIPLGVLLLFSVYQGLRYWWNHGYSRGTRTGIVRKISIKGPPYCKYLSGEMVTQGTQLQSEVWEFSVDDEADTNPVVVALQDAEKSGQRVTLRYRQDRHSMFRCTPSEYFVTNVEK